MDENRSKFLERKLNSKSNIYKGFIDYQNNHKEKYSKFLRQFNPCDGASFMNETIIKLTTRKDFIIDNYSFYIIFLNNMELNKLNSLKIHIVENFLVNWNRYEDYMQVIDPNEYNKITISSLTGSELLSNDFESNLISKEVLFSDIQFIDLTYNDKDYRKGYFDDVIKTHIALRNGRGLITIILYYSSENDYVRNNYENDIKLKRNIKRFSIVNDVVRVVNVLKTSKDNNEEGNKEPEKVLMGGALSEGDYV